MATVVDDLVVNVRSNTAQAQAGLAAVETRVYGLQTAAAGLAVVGGALTKFVTLPILALGAIGIKSFADFDSAMTESLAIMSDEAMAFRDDMELVARDVAKATTFSAKEAAESYFFLASAGFDAQQSMAALPQVALFAQAGMFDMATATDLATDAQSALGLVSDDSAENLKGLTRITDVFVKANTLANASVQQFSEAITNKAGAALRAVGKDIEEGAAVLAVFADQGLKGAAAGTALHIVMRDMQSAALRNTDAWSELGVSVFDSAGEMRNMADITGDLEGLLGGMSDKQKKLTLAQLGFTDKSIGFIQQLLGSSDAMRDYEESLRDADGYVKNVAEKQLESFKNQWNLLKSKFQDIALTIGSVLVPALRDLIDLISPYVESMAEWIEQNDELFVKILGLVAAIGPFFLILSKLVTVVGLLATPFGLIVVALAAIAYFAWKAGFTFEDLMKIVDTVMAFLKDQIAIVADWWAKNGDDIIATLVLIGEWFQSVWDEIWVFLEPLIKDIGEFVEETFSELVKWFQDNWPLILETFETVTNAIAKFMEIYWPYIQAFITGVWQAIEGVIRGAMQVILGIIEVVMGIITGDWEAAWNGVKRIVNGVWQAIHGIVSGALTILISAFTTSFALIVTIVTAGLERVKSIGKSIGEGIASALRAPITSFLNWFIGKINTVIKTINGIIGAFNKLPGPDISKISALATLGHGGTMVSGGMAKVGDRGLPEIVSLPAGATVSPLRPGEKGGAGEGMVINLNAPQNDPHGIAAEIGWELTKRGM